MPLMVDRKPKIYQKKSNIFCLSSHEIRVLLLYSCVRRARSANHLKFRYNRRRERDQTKTSKTENRKTNKIREFMSNGETELIKILIRQFSLTLRLDTEPLDIAFVSISLAFLWFLYLDGNGYIFSFTSEHISWFDIDLCLLCCCEKLHLCLLFHFHWKWSLQAR